MRFALLLAVIVVFVGCSDDRKTNNTTEARDHVDKIYQGARAYYGLPDHGSCCDAEGVCVPVLAAPNADAGNPCDSDYPTYRAPK